MAIEPGCVTHLEENVKIETLEKRRINKRLSLYAKIYSNQVPPLPPAKYISHKSKSKRNIKPKVYFDHVQHNVINKFQTKNDYSVNIEIASKQARKHSFFVQTPIKWNSLDNSEVSRLMSSIKQPTGLNTAL